jgi:hypothetical protein
MKWFDYIIIIFVFCAFVGELIVYTDKETLTSERNAERIRADSLQMRCYQLDKEKSILKRDLLDFCDTPPITSTKKYKQSINKVK